MSIRRWTGLYSRMPIKFKLISGSALLLIMLFVGYNSLQYMFLERWIIEREKSKAQHGMSDILNTFLEQETGFKSGELQNIRHYLDKVNRDDQRIRIIDASGVPVITVTRNIPEHWIEPKSVSGQELIISRGSEHSLLIMRSPLTIFEFKGTVEIVKSMDEFEELTSVISRGLLFFGLGAVVLSILVGWLLSWRLLKPLQAMAQTIRNVNSKGLQERMKPSSNGDEISTLMLMFNEMMDQVEESFQRQSRFVEDASHELRTPIAIIEGHLALLQRWGKEDPGVLNESLGASLEEFSRLKRLVLELLALSRAEKTNHIEEISLANPGEEIRRTVSRIALIYPEFRLETELESLSRAKLAISGEHLEQLLLIIMDNAVKYSLRNKTVSIVAALHAGRASIAVTDYGLGIPAKDLPYVMDRFYRVDKARSRDMGGNGLGLAIAKRLVERYKGTLEIQSEESVGTTVSITLPILFDDEPSSRGGLHE